MQSILEKLIRPVFAPGDEGASGGTPMTSQDIPSEAPEPDAGPEEEYDIEGDDPSPKPAASASAEPEAPVEDDTEEFDLNGKKFKIPKDVKPLLMTQADYTRKTAELAEQRKMLADHFEKQQQVSAAKTEKIGEYNNATKMLEKYSALDWATLRTQDPDLALARQNEWLQWRDYREKIQLEYNQLDFQEGQMKQQLAMQERAAGDARMQEAQQQLHREIPGWKDIAPKVGEYAVKDLGWTPQELSSIPDARFGKTLYLAWVGSQSLQKQKTAVQQKAQVKAAETITPLETVTPKSGGPSARVTLNNATPEQYIKIRQREMAARNGAAR